VRRFFIRFDTIDRLVGTEHDEVLDVGSPLLGVLGIEAANVLLLLRRALHHGGPDLLGILDADQPLMGACRDVLGQRHAGRLAAALTPPKFQYFLEDVGLGSLDVTLCHDNFLLNMHVNAPAEYRSLRVWRAHTPRTFCALPLAALRPQVGLA
jgi:hypothetical protein